MAKTVHMCAEATTLMVIL